MFGNLINIHDFVFLWGKVRRGGLGRVLTKLVGSREEKIKKAWEQTQIPPTNWWDIPAVQQRWNALVSGQAKVDYNDYIAAKYWRAEDGAPLRGLSLGCGTGVREERWAQLACFERIDAYDLSPQRIDFARQRAQERGYDQTVHFAVADIYALDLPAASYDVVMVEGSLHHFTPLRQILQRIDQWLKPGGQFVVAEYVGPDQFQWTDRQLEAINGLLAVLPPRYRVQWNGQTIKPKVVRPSRLSVRLSDPSEAVESARILPLLDELFEVFEVKQYGGTILHMLFNGIAHNFLADDPATQRFLRLCFEVEDALLASGDLHSDFAVAVCGKKQET